MYKEVYVGKEEHSVNIFSIISIYKSNQLNLGSHN